MSDSNLTTFEFEGQNPLRTILDDNGDPWFVAADVCRVLGLDNATRAVERLDEDERGLTSIQGSPNQMNIVNESGLFNLIFTSRKDEAKRFKKWVTSEVLPSIRKTGGYMGRPMTNAEKLLMIIQQEVEQERKLALHDAQLDDHGNRIEKLEAHTGGQNPNYFTIKGFCNLNKLRPPTEMESRLLGKKAAKLSRSNNYPIEDVPDPTYGTIHRYSQMVLSAVFQDWK